MSPRAALNSFVTKKLLLMPPQFYLISTLADILIGGETTEAQRNRVQTLSKGCFGSMVINPRALSDEDEQGRQVLSYEGDETRGGSKGTLHRSLVKFSKGGVSISLGYYSSIHVDHNSYVDY
jgi:hypothetical protein